MPKKAQYFIKEYHYRRVSKKEFIRRRKEDVKKDCTAQKYLLKDKIFSRGEIAAHQKGGRLTPIWHHRRKYFERNEILSLLKDSTQGTKRSQQLDLFEK